jgi:hypothetical protein
MLYDTPLPAWPVSSRQERRRCDTLQPLNSHEFLGRKSLDFGSGVNALTVAITESTQLRRIWIDSELCEG